MARHKDWYIKEMERRVKEELESHPKLIEQLGNFRNKFTRWCAIQRVAYEPDIQDEVEEFIEEIIRKRMYNTDVKMWRKISKEVFERDDYTCQYCGKIGGILEVDHITPISKGGSNLPGNLATSCRKCNRQKKDKTIEEFELWRQGRKNDND